MDRRFVIYGHEACLAHDTRLHPECPERITSIRAALERSVLRDRIVVRDARLASREEIEMVHDPRHVDRIAAMAAAGGGRADADTVVSPASFTAARRAAGALLEAADAAMAGGNPRAFALVRPPGHHATPDRAMGFCLFNNVAIAARYLQRRWGVTRILILDWDVHHGNGTQEIFWEDRDVVYASTHRFPFYPGTGAVSETGGGRGEGATINVPLDGNVTRATFRARFEALLDRAFDVARPEVVLVSCGFDAYREDPVGGLGLEVEDYTWMTERLLRQARDSARGRVLSVLEGGYAVEALAALSEAHLSVLAAAGWSPDS